MPKSQKEYYHNKIREFEKRTGMCMNVKDVSKFYDYKIEDAEYTFQAALDLMQKHACYIYNDSMAEEDPRSNGTHWRKYGFAHVNNKTYIYYFETQEWGKELDAFTYRQCYDKTWKAGKLVKTNFPYSLDSGEDYLPYAVENMHIGSNFDDFADENNIKLKRDTNWALKMLECGKIVTRESNPNLILFPKEITNNKYVSITVEDLFAEDWTIVPNKTLKDVMDDFYAGKTIRRKSWLPGFEVGKYAKSIDITQKDMMAYDWESIDVIEEIDNNQREYINMRNLKNCS